MISSAIHSSIHQNCDHQIILAKFSLKVHYLPPYEREVWHFKRANTDHIKRAINGFPWERSFADLDKNDKVYLFNKTIETILSNFIPYETIAFDDRDSLWINNQVEHLINEKNALYKNYLKNNKSNRSFKTFQPFQSQPSSLIASLKNKYYSKVAKRLLDPSTSPKRYWYILKTFLKSDKQLLKNYLSIMMSQTWSESLFLWSQDSFCLENYTPLMWIKEGTWLVPNLTFERMWRIFQTCNRLFLLQTMDLRKIHPTGKNQGLIWRSDCFSKKYHRLIFNMWNKIH